MVVGIDVSQCAYRTGVADYTENLINHLHEFSPRLNLKLFGSTLRQKSVLREKFPRAKLFPLPPTALNLLWNRAHIVPVEKFIGKFNVFHASDWTHPPSASPVVTTVHDLSPILFPDQISGSIVSAHRMRLQRAVHSPITTFICVSQATASDLQTVYSLPSSRIKVIYEALPSRFDSDPSPEEVKKIKSMWNLDDYIISIGTVQPRKNYEKLVEAFLRYQNSLRLPSKLVIVGGPGWGSSLPSHPAVLQTGYLPDHETVCLLHGAQVLVTPSLYEGFGLPVLAAWRQGVPVVVSNVSSLPEIAGPAAKLVDPQDTESIAHGISAGITDRKRLVSSGYTRLKLFNWSKTATATYRIYQSLC